MSSIPIEISRYSTAYDPYSPEPYLGCRSGAFNAESVDEQCRNYPRNEPSLKIDWKETPDAHVFKADLPGVKKEDMKITIVDDRILEIDGLHRLDELQEGERYRRIGRWKEMLFRRFRLPENAKMEEAKAEMENGVLTVTVPKHTQPPPQPIAVEISG